MNTATVAVIISGVAVVFTILAFFFTRRKESKEAITEEFLRFDGIKESLIKVNVKLDQVCTTTTETRSDIKSMSNQLQEMDKRITVVENDQEAMWDTLDELKNQVKHGS